MYVLGEDGMRKLEDAWSANNEIFTENAAIGVVPSLTSAKVMAETSVSIPPTRKCTERKMHEALITVTERMSMPMRIIVCSCFHGGSCDYQ